MYLRVFCEHISFVLSNLQIVLFSTLDMSQFHTTTYDMSQKTTQSANNSKLLPYLATSWQ